MPDFDELVASRKAWLSDVLQPWCQRASLIALKQAELEWNDIAGKVAPEKTLWPWAWSRFPELVHESLGIEEASEVEVTLHGGRTVSGYPDSRASLHGNLVLWGTDSQSGQPREHGPFSIEAIETVRRVAMDLL